MAEKLTPREKRAIKQREAAERAEAVFGTGKGSAEPKINVLTYDIDLLKALNYYNSAFDNKAKRKWTMAYVGKAAVADFEVLADWRFSSVGSIIRLLQRGVYLDPKEQGFIATELTALREVAAYERLAISKVVAKVKPSAPVIDRVAEEASNHIAEINGMIDEFVMNDVEPDLVAYLKANAVSPKAAKLIPIAFANTALELEEAIAGEDKQLVEGYSNFKKTKLKKLLKLYQSVSEAAQQQVVTAKVQRKPTVRKEKPASVIASKVLFLKESKELGLKSVQPVSLVQASEAWIYNTKYKRLQVYRAMADSKLTVKGTTIMGYDVSESGQKTVRKPELLKDYASLSKRPLAQAYAGLSTKPAGVNGRINGDCIILKVFP